MAAMDFIDTARNDLEEALLKLRSLMKLCEELAPPESAPEWLWVVGNHVRAVTETADFYMSAVHEHARPILKDIAAITKKV